MDIFKLSCAYMPGYTTGFWESRSPLWFGAGDFFSSVNFVGSQKLGLRKVSLFPCASVDTDESLQQEICEGCKQEGGEAVGRGDLLRHSVLQLLSLL